MEVKEEKVVKNDKEIKIREDFGDMVSSIKFRTISNRLFHGWPFYEGARRSMWSMQTSDDRDGTPLRK